MSYGPPGNEYGQGTPPGQGGGYGQQGGGGYGPPDYGQQQGGGVYGSPGGGGYGQEPYPPAGGYPPSAPGSPAGYPGESYPVSGGQGYPPPGGYPPAAPASPGGYPQYGEPPPQFPGGPMAPPPPPPPKKSSTGLIVGLVIVAVLLLGCCGGGYFIYQEIKQSASEAIDGIDDLTQTPSDGAVPTNTADAFYAQVGDCVKKAPTTQYPDQMAKAPCSDPETWKVTIRYDGTADYSKCGDADYYWEDAPGATSRDFVLCLVANP